MQVGVIGLGAMGAGMATNLAASGYSTWVWNRSPQRCEQLATQQPVQVAENLTELAKQAQLLLISVSADADVVAVIEALLPTLTEDHVILDTSTIKAQTAQQLAQRVAVKGAHFLDAPVSGGMEGAQRGTLAMMVGGDAEVLVRVMPVVEIITAKVLHMGAVGSGQKTKAVNQVMAAGINQAVTEALAFAEALDVPMEAGLQIWSGGAAGSWFVQHRGSSMVSGQFEPGFKLALHHKDLKICESMAKAHGAPIPLAAQTRADYEILMDEGQGECDVSALYTLKQRRIKRPD